MIVRLIDADVLETHEQIESLGNGKYEYVEVVYKDDIDNTPTIKPQKWISVSERLPKEKDAGILKKLGIEKKSEYVLATVEVNGERMTVTACTYDGKWDWKMKYAFPNFKVIAWMPLPEPYEKKE